MLFNMDPVVFNCCPLFEYIAFYSSAWPTGEYLNCFQFILHICFLWIIWVSLECISRRMAGSFCLLKKKKLSYLKFIEISCILLQLLHSLTFHNSVKTEFIIHYSKSLGTQFTQRVIMSLTHDVMLNIHQVHIYPWVDL
jgi:hypothetical protein